MNHVLVIDANKRPLNPCHPARARQLLKKKRAAVYRRYPFTIILKNPVDGPTQPLDLRIDPGSRTTGIALVQHNQDGQVVIWAANLNHRGLMIRDRLLKRRQSRRSRRNRKLRYRPPRFNNRRKSKGWLPPSLVSRVDNVQNWARRLQTYAPITAIQVETVRFDTQLIDNPSISGVEYQQGALFGYEIREYLLEKWGRKCAYCGAKDVPLEIEHIIPKSRGGSNRINNLAISCKPCNIRKGAQTAKEFGFPNLHNRNGRSMLDMAAVNATRYAIGNRLKENGLPVSFWSGGRTKYNRIRQGYPKDHWIDAACVGEDGDRVHIPPDPVVLTISAAGRGRRQMVTMDRYGFPRCKPKQFKRVKGFQSGDLVKAVVPKGKNAGVRTGKVVIRASGSFMVGKNDGINWKYCTLIQRSDGYDYQYTKNGHKKVAKKKHDRL